MPVYADTEAQEEFAEMVQPVLDAMPDEASAADIANIIAALVTDFTTSREDIHGIFRFGMQVAFTEAERMKNERTLQ